MTEKYQPTPEDIARNIMHPDSIKLSGDNTFYTIQGEGDSLGKPAVFMRLHECNLVCTWCDTKYTWDREKPEYWQEPKDWGFEELAAEVTRYPAKRIVITGGEPLIQKNKIDKLVELMPTWTFEIETNGTIMPTPKMLKQFQFNCSPKLRNSLNPKAARIKKDVLICLNKVNTMFKFVVMSSKDLEEIEEDFIKPFSLDVNKVVVMPQGITSEELHNIMKKIVEPVKRKGYRLLGRLQCEIWGGRRKV